MPAPGGGEYWDDSDPDHREWKNKEGLESNSREQRQIASQILEALSALLPTTLDVADPNAIMRAILGTRLGTLTEFGRAVHGEMSAILDAASRGVPVKGATLYVTTFPCHNCARHIIGAGIARVVYVAPYPKSLAPELHGDAGIFEGGTEAREDDVRTRFVSFVGVAPRRYLELFDAQWRQDRPDYISRKGEDGRIQGFDRRRAIPVFADAQPPELRLGRPLFRVRETRALDLLREVWSSGPRFS